MRLKIEFAALLIGLTGAGLATTLVTNWGAFPAEVTTFLRPGEIGFKALVTAFLIGLAGLVLMCVNLITGMRKVWGLRLLGFICFLVLSLSFGLYD